MSEIEQVDGPGIVETQARVGDEGAHARVEHAVDPGVDPGERRERCHEAVRIPGSGSRPTGQDVACRCLEGDHSLGIDLVDATDVLEHALGLVEQAVHHGAGECQRHHRRVVDRAPFLHPSRCPSMGVIAGQPGVAAGGGDDRGDDRYTWQRNVVGAIVGVIRPRRTQRSIDVLGGLAQATGQEVGRTEHVMREHQCIAARGAGCEGAAHVRFAPAPR